MDDAQLTQLLTEDLIAGYEAFLSGRFLRERGRFHDLAETGQHPHTLVIGCCDSRVAPEEIFNAEPGQIFDLRNVANLVPPNVPEHAHHGAFAAIDYAVSHLRVRNIVVLGHAQCGGVRAYVERHSGGAELSPDADDHIGDWIRILAPAAQRLGPPPKAFDAAYAERLAQRSVQEGLGNLRSFPKVLAAEQAGTLKLHGAFFGVGDARLLALDEARGVFVQVSSLAHARAQEQRA